MTGSVPARTSNAEPALNPAKFRDPFVTAKGEPRAWVFLKRLRTLWFNTGTLCNLTCRNCYIESSPRNDRLAYLSAADVAAYLDEIERDGLGTEEIGFTGGEPFMNPEFRAMLQDALRRGFQVLVLTNAMRPMMKMQAQILALNAEFPRQLVIRVSLDHYSQALHEIERGRRSWAPTLAGLVWLCRNGFTVRVAGRRFSGEPDTVLRAGGLVTATIDELRRAGSNQVSCCCDGILPLRRRFGSEGPQRGPGDEVALKIERVVDGGMHTEGALRGSS